MESRWVIPSSLSISYQYFLPSHHLSGSLSSLFSRSVAPRQAKRSLPNVAMVAKFLDLNKLCHTRQWKSTLWGLVRKICTSDMAMKQRHRTIVMAIKDTKMGWNPGGWGTQQIFKRGGSAPRSKPLTRLYTTFHENGTPFIYRSIDKWNPFHIPVYWQMVPLSYTLLRTLHPF